MLKKIFNFIKHKISFAAKPNSFIHQSTVDLVYDANENKFLNFVWKIINIINYFISYLLKRIIILYEFISIKKINNYKFFIHKNQNNMKRSLIFGSAPSLNDFDVSKILSHDVTFVCNSFHLSKISKELKANYYTILNTGWMQYIDLHDNENKMDLNSVFSNIGKKFPDSKFVFGENYIKKYKDHIENNIKNYFYFNISSLSPINFFPNMINDKSVIPHPVDVTQFNMILAYALGFKEIYLISVEHPFETDLIEGYQKASDIVDSKGSIENLSFKPKAYLDNNSKLKKEFSKIHDLETEKLYFNHAWWHWYRGYNYYYLFKLFQQRGVKIYRATNQGTLNFIPVKKL